MEDEEWRREVAEINAGYERKKLKKENERTFRKLHNEGRLQLTIYEIAPLTEVTRGKFFVSQRMRVNGKLDVTSSKTETSSLLLLRKGRKFYVELIKEDLFEITYEKPCYPCPFMYCKERVNCTYLKEHIKGTRFCVRKDMVEVLKAYKKGEKWIKLVKCPWKAVVKFGEPMLAEF